MTRFGFHASHEQIEPGALLRATHAAEQAGFTAAMHPQVLASSDPEQHVAWLAELADIGFDEVYVHHVGQEQQGFLDVYAEKVLPVLGAS